MFIFTITGQYAKPQRRFAPLHSVHKEGGICIWDNALTEDMKFLFKIFDQQKIVNAEFSDEIIAGVCRFTP
jgi:hypothetical protein